jgi:HEAT repeat protein
MPIPTRRAASSAGRWILILLGVAVACGLVLAIRTSRAVNRTNQLMALARQLNSGPPELRTNAAIALSSLPASDISLLTRAARRPNSFLEQPIQAKPPRLPPFVRRWLLSNFQPFSIPGDRQAALRALALLRTNVPPDVFVSALADPAPETASVASSALGHLGPPAVPALIDALRSPTDQVRAEACNALAAIGARSPPAAAVALGECLADQNTYVAGRAARALGQMGTNSLPVLTRILGSSPSQPARIAALTSIEQMGFEARHIVGQIALGADDPDSAVRAATARTLGNVRAPDPLSLQALMRLLEDPNSAVQVNAAQSLARAGRHAQPAIPRLETLATDPACDPAVRSNASRALGIIRGAVR